VERTERGADWGALATIPNPNRCIPMPSLATSGESFCDGVEVWEGGFEDIEEEVLATGLMGSGFLNSTSSAPHFAIRSASSLAAFSASSKEMSSVTFLTASFVGFFAPRTPPVLRAPAAPPSLLDRTAEEVVVLGTVVSADRFELLVVVAGFPLLAVPLAGEGVLPSTGGVAVREGGGVGLCTMGLSQDSKKSSDFRLSC